MDFLWGDEMTEGDQWIADDPGVTPTHLRTITMAVYDTPTTFQLDGRLTDIRPWADGTTAERNLHDMHLRLEVRRADLIITRAEARMGAFPHAECPGIAPAFAGLVGLSVSRGFTKEVQARFGRSKGCSHLEFLARALAPAVIQAIPSTALRREPPETAGNDVLKGTNWLADTCHVWAQDGPGSQKIALGWRPGGNYPAPPLEEIRRSLRSENSSS